MLRLALVALTCAHALALPTAPSNALAPHDLERNTKGAKCCKCTHKNGNSYSAENPCWKQAQCKHVEQIAHMESTTRGPAMQIWSSYPKGCEKEICDNTCKRYGAKADKFHGECDEDDRVLEDLDKQGNTNYCNRFHEVKRGLSQHTIVGLNPNDSEGSRSSAAMWN